MFWFRAEHPDTGEILDVKALVFGAGRGRRDADGAPLEPDDEAEIVICGVWTETGDPVEWWELESDLEAQGWSAVKGR